jgi:uncharacterized protein YecE (DUF72 family)
MTEESKKLYIGTAGWSYKDWYGIVYPEPRPRGFSEPLYLAQFFNVIEINTSFYHIPSMKMTERWARLVGDIPDFLYVMKLWQGFTHDRSMLEDDSVGNFRDGLEPLVDADRLGCVLVQFPWSFRYTPEHWDWMRELVEVFGRYPLAIEMRHVSWVRDKYLDLLKETGVAFCNIDQPQFGDSLPPTDYATAEHAYVRLHGRNKAMWFQQEAGVNERYNYLYRSDELHGWVEIIRRLLGVVRRVFVITNNHFRGQAVCNALQLKAALARQKISIPSHLAASFPTLEDIASPGETGEGTQLELF